LCPGCSRTRDHFDVCHRDTQLYAYVTPRELLHACTIRLVRAPPSAYAFRKGTATRLHGQICRSRSCIYAKGRGKRLRAHSIWRRRKTRRPDYVDRKRGITRLDLHSTPAYEGHKYLIDIYHAISVRDRSITFGMEFRGISL